MSVHAFLCRLMVMGRTEGHLRMHLATGVMMVCLVLMMACNRYEEPGASSLVTSTPDTLPSSGRSLTENHIEIGVPTTTVANVIVTLTGKVTYADDLYSR